MVFDLNANVYFYIYSDFVNETYKFGKKESSYIAGAVYDVSMIFSPGMGLVIVSLFYFIMISTIITLPSFFACSLHPSIVDFV